MRYRLRTLPAVGPLVLAIVFQEYLEQYADFLESHLERWTVTTEGSLVPGVRRHFIRIHPADPNDPSPM